MHYDPGHMDLKQTTPQAIDNPFGATLPYWESWLGMRLRRSPFRSTTRMPAAKPSERASGAWSMRRLLDGLPTRAE